MNRIFKLFFSVMVIISINGCASSIDVGRSQLEIPSVENQLNRVVGGIGVIRINNAIIGMPISSDAKWPEELAQDLSDANKKIIDDELNADPYIATHEITDSLQQDILGGFAFATPRVNPMLYKAMGKLVALYGPDSKKWPSFFELGSNFSHYDRFNGGKLPTKREIMNDGDSDVYDNTGEAVHGLLPVNYKKDLHSSKDRWDVAMLEVVELEAKKGDLETKVETGKDSAGKDLSDDAKTALEEKIKVLDAEVKAKKVSANEKESIYTTTLDEAVEALKDDIRLDGEQVNLAKNIILVSDTIQNGAVDAGVAFGIAVVNLAKGSMQNLRQEQASLLKGVTLIPAEKQKIYAKRIARLTKNTLYVLPAVGIGAYYAIKQSFIAEKYESVAGIILEADEARKEREKAIAEDKAAAEEKLKADKAAAAGSAKA